MKIVLWFTFYFVAFIAMIAGIYFSKDDVMEKTEKLPVLNQTRYHNDSMIADSTYHEQVDSLAVVVNGLLSQMSQYVTQLNERDKTLHLKDREISQLKQENDILKKQITETNDTKRTYNQEQNEKRLQELAKTIGGMKAEVLRPILKNMSDNVVQILYNTAKPRDRAIIFNSIEPDRAGRIMSRIAKASQKGG